MWSRSKQDQQDKEDEKEALQMKVMQQVAGVYKQAEDDAIQRLSLLQWLGDGEWTGHNQVEGPPTLSGPVESYASPEHRQQQAQARRAAAARVAAQREDSSDLAPEHPGRVSTTPRNRSSAGSSRSGDHLARFETGDY